MNQVVKMLLWLAALLTFNVQGQEAQFPHRAPIDLSVNLTGTPSRGEEHSLACGHCAARIALRDFVMVQPRTARRVADCPRCGETTIVQLANPRS